MVSVRTFACGLIGITALACKGGRQTERVLPNGGTVTYGRMSDTVVHLAGGDSIELQGLGPYSVPGYAPGLLVMYYPFPALGEDSLRLKRLAAATIAALHLDTASVPYIDAIAVNLRKRDRVGVYQLMRWSTVFDRDSAGRWQFR